ncbi:hypothetical protein [Nitrospira sp. Ecomares 2.1]
MARIRSDYLLIVMVTGVIATSGCTTTAPTSKDGTIVRTSVESFYRESPWVNAKPTNIKAMGDALVNTTQGLADISAAYSTQLQINGWLSSNSYIIRRHTNLVRLKSGSASMWAEEYKAE